MGDVKRLIRLDRPWKFAAIGAGIGFVSARLMIRAHDAAGFPVAFLGLSPLFLWWGFLWRRDARLRRRPTRRNAAPCSRCSATRAKGRG